MSNIVKEKIDDYFSSMNVTASRMMADIANSRQKFGSDWSKLSSEEQDDFLWNTLVTPEVLSKYKDTPNFDGSDYFPVLRLHPGEKIVMDDDTKSACSFGSTWRDEHSAPFRWETESQLDLRIDDCSSDDETNTLEKKPPSQPPESQNLPPPKPTKPAGTPETHEAKKPLRVTRRPEVPPPPVPPHAVLGSKTLPNPSKTQMLTFVDQKPADTSCIPRKDDMPIYAKVVKRKSASAKTLIISEMKAYQKAKEELKPAVPPRMSLELRREMDLSKYKTLPIDFDDIPKTGFDFLDNW